MSNTWPACGEWKRAAAQLPCRRIANTFIILVFVNGSKTWKKVRFNTVSLKAGLEPRTVTKAKFTGELYKIITSLANQKVIETLKFKVQFVLLLLRIIFILPSGLFCVKVWAVFFRIFVLRTGPSERVISLQYHSGFAYKRGECHVRCWQSSNHRFSSQ